MRLGQETAGRRLRVVGPRLGELRVEVLLAVVQWISWAANGVSELHVCQPRPSFISVIDFATVLTLAHQVEDLLLHLLTVPSKPHYIEHLIYRILSHVVAFPHQAHHFPPTTGS